MEDTTQFESTTPSTDAAFEPSTMGNFFSADLTTVSIERPLIKNCSAELELESAVLEEAKDKASHNIVFVLKTVTPLTSKKGDIIQPGFKLTTRIALREQDKNGRDRSDSIRQDLKRWKLCLTGDGTGSFGIPSSYVGRRGVFKITIDSDATGQYGDQNRVQPVVPAKKSNSSL